MTGGPEFQKRIVEQPLFKKEAAVGTPDAFIDASSIAKGYVAISAQSDQRLKFRLVQGDCAYAFDVPNDGTPIICPLSLGDGSYEFGVWESTRDQRYVQLASTRADVKLVSEAAPFLIPNVYCDFDATSACVAKADELAAGARNQGDVLRSVCTWIAENISYDEGKEQALAGGSGYVPNPDQVMTDGSGICFDYASLTAAMLRSQGIPCKIVTGTRLPDFVCHAWNLVYLDGSWRSVGIDVAAQEWTLIDVTLAAQGAALSGEGFSYKEQHAY